jgi:hypothetical protein
MLYHECAVVAGRLIRADRSSSSTTLATLGQSPTIGPAVIVQYEKAVEHLALEGEALSGAGERTN